jgi:PhzF family phenazine biosynthesis protein
MTTRLFQVDAFTDKPFSGNPAAVCLLNQPASDEWMQSLAAEMNLSETAFLLPEGLGWRLRWFTPRTEVDLCGHATLASARVLYELVPGLRDVQIQFHTRSGTLTARGVEDRIELNFPVMPPDPIEVPDGIERILGVDIKRGVRSGDYYLFEVESDRAVREAKPDFQALARSTFPEVIITAWSDNPAYDFVSRFFAPRLGIDEDPVTGSAHCLLTPYWAGKMDKKSFIAYQASSRGGILHVELAGERVLISGSTKIIFSADLLV